MMDRYHTGLDVYTDADSAGNHFTMKGRMAPIFSESDVPAMNEQCTQAPHSGRTDIMATFIPRGNNWGGWYFMNGVLDNGTAPIENWGEFPDAGVNLTGATKLSFWAEENTEESGLNSLWEEWVGLLIPLRKNPTLIHHPNSPPAG